jgi:hypothetical protein
MKANLKKQNKNRIYKSVETQFKQVEQVWDFDNPCKQGCGRVWLKSSGVGTRRLCCMNGQALRLMPKLDPMVNTLQSLAYNQNEQFCLNSNVYNNLLAFSATGVDNGKGGGYDQFFGKHCVRINGRTYHT